MNEDARTLDERVKTRKVRESFFIGVYSFGNVNKRNSVVELRGRNLKKSKYDVTIIEN